MKKQFKIIHLFTFVFFLCNCVIVNNILAQISSTDIPKNIIIMIGDGMGFNHLKATEYYLYGDMDSCKLRDSSFVKLAMATYPAFIEIKPERVLSSGYNAEAIHKNPVNLNNGYTESAAAATAIACGKKTYNGAIGMGVMNDTLPNLTELAKSLGKSAGIVTSVPISHATPAGFVAHCSERRNYQEIARQMLLDSRLDVLMGCGNPDYDKNGTPANMNSKYLGGDEVWEQLKNSEKRTEFHVGDITYSLKDIDNDGEPDAWTLIQDSSDFAKLTKKATAKRILGIPKVNETLQEGRDDGESQIIMPFEKAFIPDIPSLEVMTKGALNVLNQQKKGFFLMVEGGAIDWASHDNRTDRMLEENIDFLNTIESVIKWISIYSNWEETLLIVTADHECGFLWAEGGNDQFNPIINSGKNQIPQMKWYSGDHTNSLVPFFAKGAASHLFNIFADEYDPHYGYYIQNTEIAQTIFLLWNK